MWLVTFEMEKKPICWLLENNEFIYRECAFNLLKLRKRRSIYLISQVIMPFSDTEMKKSRELVHLKINKESRALVIRTKRRQVHS